MPREVIKESGLARNGPSVLSKQASALGASDVPVPERPSGTAVEEVKSSSTKLSIALTSPFDANLRRRAPSFHLYLVFNLYLSLLSPAMKCCPDSCSCCRKRSDGPELPDVMTMQRESNQKGDSYALVANWKLRISRTNFAKPTLAQYAANNNTPSRQAEWSLKTLLISHGSSTGVQVATRCSCRLSLLLTSRERL